MTLSKKQIWALAGVGAILVAAILYFTVLPGLDRDSSGGSRAAAQSMARYRAGQLEIGIATDPVTPRVGNNRLIIELRDADGNLVSGIPVNAHAEMPAMGQMPAMRAPADLTETSPGRFEGSMNLSMRGEWPLTLEIDDPERGNQRLQFDLATDRGELAIAAGGTPVGASSALGDDANVITIDNRRRQMIGVETGETAYRELILPIRAVGRVTYDERLLSHVTLKFDGYIGDLKADYVGTPIEAGQALFTVYSPELLAAQQEYLETLQRRGAGESTFLRAARQRLRLWDISEGEIEALERRGAPEDYVTIYAPRGGTLIERHVADGGAARMGQTLLSIADLSRVWIEAEVFEADLELVEQGMTATVTLPYLPGRRFEASVDYVYPYLEGATRTARVRLTLDNPNGALKPDMYAEVSLQAELGERLSVPEEAVIIAGDSRVVFVDLGEGRLKPVRIRTGRRAQGLVEVLDGLTAGDTVVTSGNFLLAAETRLKTGIEQW
jgi:Cu(I)/Ag(I) efflux system membrane fusion protein